MPRLDGEEEFQASRRVLPEAVVLSLVVGGVLVIVACLGIVLAIPDMAAALSGKDTNPIATTLVHSYGSGTGRTLLVALAIGFICSVIAVQTAVTRAIWANARDRLLPGPGLLVRLSGREHLPRYAIWLTVIIAGALIFGHVQGLRAARVVPPSASSSRIACRSSHWATAMAWASTHGRRVGDAFDWRGRHRGRGLADRRDRRSPLAQAGQYRVVSQLGDHHHDRGARRLGVVIPWGLPAGFTRH